MRSAGLAVIALTLVTWHAESRADAGAGPGPHGGQAWLEPFEGLELLLKRQIAEEGRFREHGDSR